MADNKSGSEAKIVGKNTPLWWRKIYNISVAKNWIQGLKSSEKHM